ncbi:9-O-acetylesterase [Salinimicrobium marinum]|uniref:9-O-acetylesterase n=1 Tax=Salinimicrobium marinum TaxID=680283 RepID=A0A918SDW1_9FLAO|nr:sialate O-acetylesterase [Salinimicrobium marinum]GHA36843.1 9-O-acetylesterase [Salinimicrobium marinum]
MAFFRSFLALFFFSNCSIAVFGQVKLPKLINDGMVLQRNSDIKIWGWASKEESISIFFLDKEYNTVADNNGKWSVSLNDLKAGGPFQMQIKGSNSIQLEDIYIGDVWLASGQSNMEIPMGRVSPLYPEEIAKASNEAIRFFEVPKTFDFNEAKEDLEGGEWVPVAANTIEKLSAVAYFFAKDLYAEYDIPIGIINSALGGSPAEAWISEEALKEFPEHHAESLKYQSKELRDSIETADQTRIGKWYSDIQKKDKGVEENWKAAEIDDSSWKTMDIPGYWADTEFGPKNGVVWFRKTINLQDNWTQGATKLLLGRIVDADSVFVNGKFVGNTTYQYPPRRYEIPEGVLKSGENTISIRIINESGRGGFVEEKEYKLISGEKEMDLTGTWKFKLGAEMPRLQGQTFIRWKPVGLYNAMINPLTDYSINGVIWYQGESNADTPWEYEALMTSLIKDWRNKWNQEDLPFLYVQLANFMESKDQPGDSNWARLRDAQLKTLAVPHTGMAVAIDVGEANDIHPLNKKDVGERLARAAKNVAYGEDIVPAGPLFKSFKKEGDSIVISFKNTGGGLVSKNGKSLSHFSIAGKDGKFRWANAEIRGDKIVVNHPEVKDPVAVRYAWADNPEGANLYNEEGLPASPFRTDEWD